MIQAIPEHGRILLASPGQEELTNCTELNANRLFPMSILRTDDCSRTYDGQPGRLEFPAEDSVVLWTRIDSLISRSEKIQRVDSLYRFRHGSEGESDQLARCRP